MKLNLPLVSKQSPPKPETHSVQSGYRALDLLGEFPAVGSELGRTCISSYINTNKANSHRLLAILEVRGYVERTADRRRLRLGERAFELGAGVYFNVYCWRWS